MTLLKREEILTLARQAKLMLLDGNVCYMNDMATDKELISLVRLIESALKRPGRSAEGRMAACHDHLHGAHP
jgi:hypothetical protein